MSRRAKGVATATFRALAIEFRNLSDEDGAYFKELGQVTTVLSPGFRQSYARVMPE